MRTVGASALVLLLSGHVCAAPKVTALFPVGGRRGTTVKVQVQGEGLKELSGMHVFGTGVSGTFEPGGDDKSRTVVVTVAPDAALGRRELRFFDANDVSNARYFEVGAQPEAIEAEPNNDAAHAQRLDLPVTVNGRIHEYGEIDGYAFSGRKGETLVAEIRGLRVMGQVGESWLKGYLEITDAAGNTIVSSQGTSDDYYRWDPVVSFTPETDGEYRIWFRDLNYRGDARAVYRLTLGATPHATGIFPLGGQRGSTVAVAFAGPLCGAAPRDIVIPSDAPDFLSISLTAASGATNERPFQVSDWPETLQVSGNDRRETAQTVPFPCVVNGRFSPERTDYYRFTVPAKQTALLEVFSRRVGTPADPEIVLRDAKGATLQTDDDGRGGRDCGFLRELPAGEYTVAVREVMGRGGDAFPYRLWLAPPRPTLRATVSPDAARIVRGAEVRLKVHVDRLDTANGDVTVTLQNPPSGVSAEPVVIPQGKSDAEIVIRAASDAPLGLNVLAIDAMAGALKVRAAGSETYNIQGTAFQRDMTGPVLFVAAK